MSEVAEKVLLGGEFIIVGIGIDVLSVLISSSSLELGAGISITIIVSIPTFSISEDKLVVALVICDSIVSVLIGIGEGDALKGVTMVSEVEDGMAIIILGCISTISHTFYGYEYYSA